jgi:type IV pilus assembly protein PilO
MAMTLKVDFNKMPWYGQLGVFAALGIGLLGAFWQFYASSAQQAIDVQRAELQRVQVEIDKGLATAKRLPEFRKEIAVLEGQDRRLRAALPEEQDVADLLRRVQGMATQSNLTIKGFEPQAVGRREIHAEWPIGLKLEGTYHDLGAFLERVSKFPRIINVGEIKITARTGGGATVSAECTATTFVLMEQPAEPAAAPGAAPAKRAAATPQAANKEAA